MTHARLIIDARPRGPRGPLATELIAGRSVLAHLVELARQANDNEIDEDEPVCVHARADEQSAFALLFDEFERPRLTFVTGPTPEGSRVLRSDRVYDPSRLKRVIHQGRDPEAAVIWRLDNPHSLAGVEDELIRRHTYQPIGKYWAFGPARSLARRLVPTPIRPNMVTTLSALTFLTGAAIVAWGEISLAARFLTAVAFAIALVLDTADGHLARLQGTASSFGRWLDSNLDELGDMALHAAIAWSSFVRDGWAGWLVIGMIYGMGKYLFMVGHEVESNSAPKDFTFAFRIHPIKQAVRVVGHADVRWHLWVALALLGRLELALVAYAIYFPVRATARAVIKGVAHA